ncbi:hypothetical protein OHU11_30100 [Streptomyces sp. NBC_00257]|uniref:hypothetical protein n=1 Tax=unclassified Streptomyces TaxID=2593676 RepID=UPI00225779E3|nr:MULTISPECIES: hypothetical protein [unclassified Streptomyces]MCX5431906.1 hypothetical protein [Streptomyces sp. NBC_00062]
MSWFKIDDGFHCHPKVFAAGTPAIGLYVRCGSWAAQQVTDGVIPKQIAKLYGTPRMIKALVDAGLWHQKGHECESCPELDSNSYAIHQYLERNPSRVETELARKSKSERQQRWREGKKKGQVDDGDGSDVDGDVDASTSRHGDAAPDPTRPVPSRVPPAEEPPPYPPHHLPATYGGGQEAAAVGPDWLQPLTAAMGQAGMHVPWKFKGDDQIRLHNDIKRLGIPLMVEQARRGWQSARTPVVSSRFFYDSWHALPTPQPTSGRPSLHAVGGPSKTTEYLEDMAAIAEELRQKKMGGA